MQPSTKPKSLVHSLYHLPIVSSDCKLHLLKLWRLLKMKTLLLFFSPQKYSLPIHYWSLSLNLLNQNGEGMWKYGASGEWDGMWILVQFPQLNLRDPRLRTLLDYLARLVKILKSDIWVIMQLPPILDDFNLEGNLVPHVRGPENSLYLLFFPKVYRVSHNQKSCHPVSSRWRTSCVPRPVPAT